MADIQAITIEPHAEAVQAVVCQARLDDTVIDRMQEQVMAAAKEKPGLPVILDISRVEYVPSLGLGALVGMMRRLRQDNHRFIIVGLQPEIRNLLTITRLDKLFEIRSNVDDALSHVRGESGGG